jgi:hypothetical protein
VTERDRTGLTAVLPADAQFDLGANLPAFVNSYPYEPAYPFGVKNLERVVRENTPIYVRGKEPARIIPA